MYVVNVQFKLMDTSIFSTWKHWILISVRNFLLIVFEENKDEYENVYEPELVINRKVISNYIIAVWQSRECIISSL